MGEYVIVENTISIQKIRENSSIKSKATFCAKPELIVLKILLNFIIFLFFIVTTKISDIRQKNANIKYKINIILLFKNRVKISESFRKIRTR